MKWSCVSSKCFLPSSTSLLPHFPSPPLTLPSSSFPSSLLPSPPPSFLSSSLLCSLPFVPLSSPHPTFFSSLHPLLYPPLSPFLLPLPLLTPSLLPLTGVSRDMLSFDETHFGASTSSKSGKRDRERMGPFFHRAHKYQPLPNPL